MTIAKTAQRPLSIFLLLKRTRTAAQRSKNFAFNPVITKAPFCVSLDTPLPQALLCLVSVGKDFCSLILTSGASASGINHLSGDPLGVIGDQPSDNLRGVRRLAPSALRFECEDLLVERG